MLLSQNISKSSRNFIGRTYKSNCKEKFVFLFVEEGILLCSAKIIGKSTNFFHALIFWTP